MAELTKRQKAKMEKHKKHHTPRHMRMMTNLMKQGKSFSEAHAETQKKVGS